MDQRQLEHRGNCSKLPVPALDLLTQTWMNLKYKPSIIDLSNLLQHARGDEKVIYRYLNQFRELVPPRLVALRQSMRAEDRLMVRQTLHKMNPQLQFFQVKGVIRPIQRLESEYLDLPMPELKRMVNNILLTLEKALAEVEAVLAAGFE